jgi:hypothetical protein
MILSIALACVIALIFAVLGAAKILAVPAMRKMAAHAGFSVAAYRRIGVLEVAGAIGVALGPAVRPFGGLAGAGLLLLLAGALTTHVRNHDAARALVSAAVCAMLVAGYLAALFGAAR